MSGQSPPRAGVSGYWSLIKTGYEELVKAIIRPPRAEYTLDELGPSTFEYGGVQFIREDNHLANPRGIRLACSLWRRRDMVDALPCVIYMHGNASCRAEALQVLAGVLATGASLFAFDFAGCGMSEGEFISLGWFEKVRAMATCDHERRVFSELWQHVCSCTY
jgi:hypothetical protein